MSREHHIVRRSRPGLGTLVEIRATGTGRVAVERAVDRAFQAIAQVQAWMSPFHPDSDIARLNTSSVGTVIEVRPATWQVLGFAQALSEASGGVFDITVGGPGGTDWRAIERLKPWSARRTAPVRVDLGGVAKGFAVDCAVAALRAGAAESAVVNAGGDLRAFGRDPERVQVRDPRALGRLVAIAELRNAALATSANYLDSVGAERLVHPGGAPLWLGRGSVSVQARTAMVADALTKVVAALGPRAASPVLHAHRAAALALTEAGVVVRSEEPRIRPSREEAYAA